MPRAAILGNLVLDEVAGAAPRPGGAVYYCGRALREINPAADVVLVCRCAEADRETLLPAVEALGFPVVWRAAERTTRFAFHYEGDRRIMRLDQVGDPWTADDVAGWVGDALGEAEWVLVGALVRDDAPLELLSALTGRGHRLVLDAQGIVRRGTPGPLVSDGQVDRRLFEHVTALKLNDEEAEILCGGTDPQALRGLGVPEVILTLGSQGAVIVNGEETAHVDAVPVDGPVDPTGAGDSFLVAYAVERLRGATPREAGLAASRFVSTIIAR
jgi:sugar/nucleoside kinase (ribokinase family)